MASSRKPAASEPVGAAQTPIIGTPFEQAVAAECERRLFHLRERGVAVACSGGKDSTALLHVLARQSARLGFRLVCLHVDHGLQPASADWAWQVGEAAAQLGVAADARRVDVTAVRELGVEAAARSARYAALAEMCAVRGVGVLALGHHALDQAETLLMRLLRGAGPGGLAAMRDWRVDGSELVRWRPMLNSQPAEIAAYLAHYGLEPIDDPSNASDDYLRNALRHRVLAPLLDIAPQALGTIGRSTRLLASAADSLLAQAQSDLAACRANRQTALCFPEFAKALRGPTLDLARLAALDDFRRASVLQLWGRGSGVEPPPEAWLVQAWRQMNLATPDADPDVRWQGWQWSRHRGGLDCLRPSTASTSADTLAWDGQAHWSPTGWPGGFCFERCSSLGVPGALLRSLPLVARARKGGEQLGMDPRRPLRSLKHWYQSLGLPPALRRRAPLLWLGDRLLHVPGIGTEHRCIAGGDDVWQIRWAAD
ncbi:tRNA lysidine(34) synthetase TilS [Derxia gummosa]|uniref:tRNA(Ile)-lysidine synthase n=1 Tax=Derxia gummosa DSM 723 TaxID=1121388 RepID=A0A8B6X9I2_9BURK|nr:tRNA lysidine(34) synthetase TilS [Derxia gummosa]